MYNDHNDYQRFLKLHEKYIHSIADTYAWALMKNHFHLLVKILRQKWNMGEKTPYMPPVIRKKSRFHNLSKLIKWGVKMNKNWNSLPPDVKSELGWLTTNKETCYKELLVIVNIIVYINTLLKNHGFNKKIEQQIFKYLKPIRNLSEYGNIFLNEIKEYIKTLHGIIQDKDRLLCSSDIIESKFGKMKFRINNFSEFGAAEFTLAIEAISENNKKEHVLKAMENTTEKDIMNWRKKNIATSLYQKKAKIFSKKRGQKNT